MTEIEWLANAEWEGGVVAAFDHGLRTRDLSDNVDPELRALLQEAEDLWNQLDRAIEKFELVAERYEIEEN